ncbi:hypothetical protein CYMTET_55256 [Cymbomonas tetramitiformis]|uniref:Helicase ATP-binding domain-containing protein n=1 Tax=Cymbomonas tetramitiformis TaxID=36881 RepID=A0AAE0BEP5_9CHLO|nr:hypothetical protein CYMTET_55256 [Cymbomonas tetramitiformis]
MGFHKPAPSAGARDGKPRRGDESNPDCESRAKVFDQSSRTRSYTPKAEGGGEHSRSNSDRIDERKLHSAKRQRTYDESGRDERGRQGQREENTTTYFSSEVDWESSEGVLAEVFHRRTDAYPQGGLEHSELQDFVPKLARFRAKQAAARAGESRATDVAAAERLGFPTHYHPRYKVNAAIVTEHSSRRAAWEGALPAAQVESYREMLVMYEDFMQKRSFSKLVQLAKDKARLPIANFMEEIVDAVRGNPVVVIAGDTGCGKSTQLPQYLVRAGFTRMCCTQPRRISAIALCRRVSYETLNEHGDDIAYHIRFDSSCTSSSKVIFLTEGVLLRKMAADPALSEFDVVIIDEVHERHLNTDLLLGLLRDLLRQRTHLRVVLMSATINVPGRLHPIRLEHVRVSQEERPSNREVQVRAMKGGRKKMPEKLDPKPYMRLLERIDQQYPKEQRGDMLVFLSGMNEIQTLVRLPLTHPTLPSPPSSRVKLGNARIASLRR